jgi:hypothetical protein
MKDLFNLLKQIQHKALMKSITETFTLEEAVESLAWVKSHLEQAHQELDELHDNLMLTKRLHSLQYAERLPQEEDFEKLVGLKMKALETALEKWTKRFAERGFYLRDFEDGIVEFRYKTANEDSLFLCWQEGEDGILYFREPDEPYVFRKPITFLPD